MPNDFKVGEDWTDSDKNFSTTGTLASGSQTVTGNVDASGTVEGSIVNQNGENVLDESDLITNGGNVVESEDIVNAGPSAPVTPFAGMLWFDSANHLLKVRNEANTSWLSIWDLTNNKPIITNLTDEILGTMLADAVAGAGLIKDGSENLAVQVDDSTIEISTDTLQIKPGGSVISVSSNDTTPGVLNGKLVAGDNVTLTEGSDGGNEVLTVDTKFRGALVFLGNTGDFAVADAASDNIDWTDEQYDTDNFADLGGANPDRLTVTAANISRVRVKLQLLFGVTGAASTTNTLMVVIQKNGGNIPGGARADLENLYVPLLSGVTSLSLETAVLSVSQNDYFTVEIYWLDISGNGSLTAKGSTDGDHSWFSIEVVE